MQTYIGGQSLDNIECIQGKNVFFLPDKVVEGLTRKRVISVLGKKVELCALLDQFESIGVCLPTFHTSIGDRVLFMMILAVVAPDS